MRKTLLLFAFIVIGLQVTQAQEIEMKINFWGYKFIQNGERLSMKELLAATDANEKAYALIRKARTQNTLSTIFSFTSGALIGIPIGQSLGGEDPNWTLAYIGGAIAVISIPLSFGALNNFNKGIDTYNVSKAATGYHFKPEFKISAGGNGVGLSINF